MKKNKFVNEGGINGSGQGIINTNSQDYLILRQKIEEAAKARNPIARIEDKLLGIRFRMESYLKSTSGKDPIPVGKFLQECIQVMNVKNKYFAAYILREKC